MGKTFSRAGRTGSNFNPDLHGSPSSPSVYSASCSPEENSLSSSGNTVPESIPNTNDNNRETANSDYSKYNTPIYTTTEHRNSKEVNSKSCNRASASSQEETGLNTSLDSCNRYPWQSPWLRQNGTDEQTSNYHYYQTYDPQWDYTDYSDVNYWLDTETDGKSDVNVDSETSEISDMDSAESSENGLQLGDESTHSFRSSYQRFMPFGACAKRVPLMEEDVISSREDKIRTLKALIAKQEESIHRLKSQNNRLDMKMNGKVCMTDVSCSDQVSPVVKSDISSRHKQGNKSDARTNSEYIGILRGKRRCSSVGNFEGKNGFSNCKRARYFLRKHDDKMISSIVHVKRTCKNTKTTPPFNKPQRRTGSYSYDKEEFLSVLGLVRINS